MGGRPVEENCEWISNKKIQGEVMRRGYQKNSSAEICGNHTANSGLLKESKSVVFEIEVICHSLFIQGVTFDSSCHRTNIMTISVLFKVVEIVSSNIIYSACKNPLRYIRHNAKPFDGILVLGTKVCTKLGS